MPGAEVLGREVAAADFAQVVVDVGRTDTPGLARLVFVLEQLLARNRLAAPHDQRDPRVVERHLVLDAALAAKAQLEGAAVHRGVPVAQRRQPIRAVAARTRRCRPAPASRGPRRARAGRRHAAPSHARRGRGCAARRHRTRACARTLWRRARRASRRGNGTACAGVRRDRSPAGGRRCGRRSTRRCRPAGSPGDGSDRAAPCRASACRRASGSRSRRRARCGAGPASCRRRRPVRWVPGPAQRAPQPSATKRAHDPWMMSCARWGAGVSRSCRGPAASAPRSGARAASAARPWRTRAGRRSSHRGSPSRTRRCRCGGPSGRPSG